MSRSSSLVAAFALAACSAPTPPPAGRIIVAITIDWEGADLAQDGFDALAELRRTLGPAVPITHFVSAAYFTKHEGAEAEARTAIAHAVVNGDELAVHLHVWSSLARASGVTPRTSPSFLSGTDEVVPFDDGDRGFDTDPDTYSVAELRAMLRTSRTLLEKTGLPVSKTFRAAGYLTTPKTLLAIRSEGFAIDSSEIDARTIDKDGDQLIPRIAQVWPGVDPTAQPFLLPSPTSPLIEMPIAAVADFSTIEQIYAVFDAAHARLQQDPTRDVVIVLGMHLETASDFGSRLGNVLVRVRARPDVAGEVVYATVEHAAELASFALVPAPAAAL